MANPGADDVNVEADNVLSEKRQSEIARVADLLERFRPTKIAVELTAKDEDNLDRWYDHYLSGDPLPIPTSELDQLAFRLAERMGHQRVYPIDHKTSLPIERTFQYAQTHGQEKLVELAREPTLAFANEFKQIQAKGSVLDLLRLVNGPVMERVQGFYMASAQIGKDSVYIGADMASAWYERNLKIFANIARLVETNDERILVIIGAGHGTLLRRFVRDAHNFDLVPLDKYLALER